MKENDFICLDILSGYKFLENVLQKVEYRGHDSPSKADYSSVVRSCSQGECIPHSDNCSDTMKIDPGCMVRYCCDNYSLCNQAGILYVSLLWMILGFIGQLLN